MIGNQVAIKFSAGAVITDNVKTGKLNTAIDGFSNILLSIIQGSDESINYNVEDNGIADNTAADSTTVKNEITNNAAAESTTANKTIANNAAADSMAANNIAATGAAASIITTVVKETGSTAENRISADNTADEKNKTADNAMSDSDETCFDLLAPDISVIIPSNVDEAEKPLDKTAVKKPDLTNLSDEPSEAENTDKPAYTVQSVMAMAGYRITDFNLKTEDGTDSTAFQPNSEPVKAGSRNGIQSLVDHVSVISNGIGEDNITSAGSKLAEPFAAANTRLNESGDYKLFTGIISDNSADTESSILKKADKKADDAPETLSVIENKKGEPANNLSMTRFETRSIEYSDLSSKEVKSVEQSAQYDSGITDQLSDGIKAGAEKSEESLFKIKLKPEGLGEVVVKLSRKSDTINVELSAELPSTKELISKELDSLRVRLNSDVGEKQYQFTSVTVENKTYGTNTSFSSGQYSRGGYNSDYGKDNNEYKAQTASDEKTVKLGYERYGNRLIDCIA